LTHVAALRKEVDWQRSFCQGDGVAQSKAQESAKEAHGKQAGSSVARKRARYTYSLKASKAKSHHGSSVRDIQGAKFQGAKFQGAKVRQEEPSKEGIVLPTPVLKRVRGHLMSSPIQNLGPADDATTARGGKCHHLQECCANRCVLELELAALRTTTIPSRFFLYESIFRALDALLRATSTQRPNPRASKSLLAMCLRKIPDYVAELEFWEKQDAETNGSRSAHDGLGISFEIYSELESLGAGNSGWKHLSEVVRAHGIKVVQTAISEGLIDLEFSILLARLCSESPSFANREALIEAIVSRQYAKPSGADDWFAKSSETMPLEILIPSSRKVWAAPFRARLMSNLVNSKLLPREWILTRDFGTIWSWTVRDLVRKNTGQDTMPFIITSIRTLCDHKLSRGRKNSSSDAGLTIAQQTLISALTALVTTALLGQQTLAEDPKISTKRRIRTINRRIAYIIQACLAGRNRPRNSYIRPSTYVLLLATFFLDSPPEEVPEVDQLGGNRYREMLEGCWNGDDNGPNSYEWKQQYEVTLALTCSIAQCCGRGATVAANAYLTKLCDRLGTARNPPRNLRQDAAFLLADQTGDLRDLAFAEGLEAQHDTDTAAVERPRQTPSRKTAFAGFRWDEGISEWVTASPVLVRRRRMTTTTATLATTTTTTGRAASSVGDLERTSRDVTPRRRESAQRQLGDTPLASATGEDTQAIGIETWIAGTSCSIDELVVVEKEEQGKENIPRRSRPKRKSAELGLPLAVEYAEDAMESLDDDEDELWGGGQQAGLADQSGGRRPVKWHAPAKRRRARGSLQSRQPLKTIPNAYYDCGGSSGDELGL